jgi:hypothetical protein
MKASVEDLDLDFLPDRLVRQCFFVIENYHSLHGFLCLPDILWRIGLDPFIKGNATFNKLFAKASKASNILLNCELYETKEATSYQACHD